MNAEQRIRLIRIIEKIEKNPEFSNKLGLKNTFQKEKKDVISIIYYLYDLVCWKIFYIWFKSILGNHEITLHSYFLSHDIDRDGSMRVNIYSLSAVDHWWDYRTFNFTYIKRAAMNQKWSIAARGLWIILTFLFRHLEVQD